MNGKKIEIIYVDINDREKISECGKQVQAGKLKLYGYNMDMFMYIVINLN